jgi:hypothetical protein
MKTMIPVQKLLYAAVALLAIGFLGIVTGAVYGRWETEDRFFVSLIFYIGLVLGAIGFLGLAFVVYSRFDQRNRFGADDN